MARYIALRVKDLVQAILDKKNPPEFVRFLDSSLDVFDILRLVQNHSEVHVRISKVIISTASVSQWANKLVNLASKIRELYKFVDQSEGSQ